MLAIQLCCIGSHSNLVSKKSLDSKFQWLPLQNSWIVSFKWKCLIESSFLHLAYKHGEVLNVYINV